MFRRLFAASLLLLTISGSPAQEPAAPLPLSTVYYAQDDQAIDRFEENAARTGPMVDALVMAATGKTEIGAAWRSLVTPQDKVGIKLSTAGGRYFSSHRGIVSAVVAGLQKAGVPRKQIILWDRTTNELRAAGYLPKTDDLNVVAVDPPRGLDRQAVIVAPMLGKLMWGDLLFAEKQRVPLGQPKSESDQLSSSSHLASVVSRDLTKIINLPMLVDHHGCGVAGAFYNVTVPNVDNWRRFTQTEGSISGSPADLYVDERIRPKVVLHIMDGLLAQYAGGPTFNPNYAFPHQTIYVSKDPVALDIMALRKIDTWRKEAKLPPLIRKGNWLEYAAALGLGNFAEDKITQQAVAVPK